MEVWKKIPNYENYEVSNLGNVKSLKFGKERILKPVLIGIKRRQYFSVKLCNKGEQKKNFKVHQLVAMGFLNHKPNGYKGLVVDHIDNNKFNNNVENLQLITQRENTSKDKIKTSSKYIGVTFVKKRNKWQSRIRINGIHKHLGYFDCELKAYYEYKKRYNEVVNTK